MEFNEYQKLALRTVSSEAMANPVLNGVMGLCGESGECIDLVKKHMFQGHDLNKERLIDEASDCLWYLALLAEGLGVGLSEIAEHNVAKLKKRYPLGFSAENSINKTPV